MHDFQPQGNDQSPDVISGDAQGRLKSFFERIERVREDAAALKEDEKEIFAEAAGAGFDKKVMRIVLKLRSQDASKRQETEALVDLYVAATGGL